jgi:glyoxylase-like metal-dependent hydrolase (beta-lactamase superfamily II)
MINYWQITPLYFGCIYGKDDTPKVDKSQSKDIVIPYIGFYLTDGRYRVLVDTGINATSIVNGITRGGHRTDGGESYVLNALQAVGVRSKELDMVVYTHLHYDHAGNSSLFPQALHVFQDTEWKELLDPLPTMVSDRVFDPSAIGRLRLLRQMRVAGDVPLYDGVDLLHTPGHSAGSQTILVRTKKGKYVLSGDTLHNYFISSCYMSFPSQGVWVLPDGVVVQLSETCAEWLRKASTCIMYDHYAWFRSLYRIRTIVQDIDHLLPSHEPAILGRTFG